MGYAGSGIYFRGRVISTAGLEGMAYAGGVAGPRRCGEKGGNAWGMRDMTGNVCGWCCRGRRSGEPWRLLEQRGRALSGRGPVQERTGAEDFENMPVREFTEDATQNVCSDLSRT